jgi:hypothetical protein
VLSWRPPPAALACSANNSHQIASISWTQMVSGKVARGAEYANRQIRCRVLGSHAEEVRKRELKKASFMSQLVLWLRPSHLPCPFLHSDS